MIAKLLAVQGVNADWINTGALRVLDADGKETLYINADTGEVRATPTLFSLSGKSVGDIANAAVEDFVNKVYRKDLEKLQNQIDGKVEEYYYAYEPTLDNLPASEWKTEEDKKAHEGDKFFDKSTGHAYRFFRNDKTGEYEWTLIQDADAIEALNKAAHAQETADGKRRVFITTPQPPYDPGDLWVQGSTGDIMVCKTGKEEGVYKSDDWVKSNKYTDDKKAEEALEAIEKLKTLNVVLNNEHQTVSTDADGNYKNFPEVANLYSREISWNHRILESIHQNLYSHRIKCRQRIRRHHNILLWPQRYQTVYDRQAESRSSRSSGNGSGGRCYINRVSDRQLRNSQTNRIMVN